MFVAIDRTSKFAFVELHETAKTATALDFLHRLIAGTASLQVLEFRRQRIEAGGGFAVGRFRGRIRRDQC